MSLYHKWAQQLKENEQQRIAFERTSHTVVIAGPGSGKTRVLALKIAQLLREEIIPPQGIACLTYTRVMANELENRLYSLGVSNRPNVVVSTVHGFCLGNVLMPFLDVCDLFLPKPIRVAPFSIQESCLRRAFEQVIGGGDFKKFKDRFFKYRRQRADKSIDQWNSQKEIAEAIRLYEETIIGQGYVDFDLIVQVALQLIINQDMVRQYLWARFPWFAVDEYQDLGYPLYRIVAEMIQRTDVKLFAIGDPDQCIFDFAGTNPKYLIKLSMMRVMQPKIKLELNYRSCQEIINVAQVILGESRDHRSDKRGGNCQIIECPKGIYQQAEQIIKFIKACQSNGISNDQIAVLHRYRDDLNVIAEALERAKIDYVLDKNKLYDRRMVVIRWLEDLAYWCLKGYGSENIYIANPRSTFDELLNTWLELGYSHKLGFENDTNHARIYLAEVLWNLREPNQFLRDWLVRVDDALDLSAVLDLYKDQYPDETDEYKKLLELIAPTKPLHGITLSKFANATPCVQLTTIHSSKGTEFEVVIIAGVERIEKSQNGKRLFYVGVTRAKSSLCLLYTQRPPHRNTHRPEHPIYIAHLCERAKTESWRFVSCRVAK